MAKSRYPKWAFAAIAAGAVLTAIEVVGAVGYLVNQNQPSYLVAGGAVVTIVAAGLLPLAERCWRRGRRLLAALLVAALVPALSVIVVAAVERTGGAKDTADRDRQAIAQKIELAREAVKDAKAEVVAAEAKATAECATGRGPRCLQLEAKVEDARKRVEAARGEQAKAGVAPKDPMASRLAAVLPVSEADIALYQPLILPLSISALGLLLIAAGTHSPKHRKVRTRKGKRKKGRRPTSPRTPSSAKVIPLRRRA